MKYGFKEYKRSQIKRDHLRLGADYADGRSFHVNSLYFEKDKKPWIGIMGEYHYVRDSRENWKRELLKMKAAGITVVASYVFWIYHEEIEGETDFTGDRDLREFIRLCGECGLLVVLRIGPWAHGEVRNGGFPDWLMAKPFEKRKDDPKYLDEVRRWYGVIYDEISDMLYKDRGPIVAIQIENELTDQPEHLKTLRRIAEETGFDAPLWTVTGWNSLYGAKIPTREYVPVFGAYVDAPWAEHNDKLPPSKHYTFEPMRNDAAIGMDLIDKADDDGWRLPYEDYPFATCELGSGLPIAHRRRSVVSGMDAYALSLVKLGCGNNLVGYYMYHGGTNKIGKLSTLQESTATGYPNDYPILNYDFHTCLTQYGETREQYRLTNLLHLFINDFGDVLSPMEFVAAEDFVKEDDPDGLRLCMRTDGESGFVFVDHYQRFLELSDVTGAVIDTGNVVFPPIDVKGECAFILPFNITLGERLLKYATAQLLCMEGDTVFFAAIPGIEPVYSFDGAEDIRVSGDGIAACSIGKLKIVTLPWEDALYLRKTEGKLLLGDGCDLYVMDGEVRAVQDGRHSYKLWDGNSFLERTTGSDILQAHLSKSPCGEPFTTEYMEHLFLGGERPVTWYELSVDSPEGFVEIDDRYDAAQIYTDGELAADNYYYGEPWRIPARLIFNKKAYLAESELKDDFYREF